MAALPREAQLEYVVYEPALASLTHDGFGDPVDAARDAFVEAPRAACLSADEAMRADARARALAEPSWNPVTLSLTVSFANGATGELELSDDEEILKQLTALYGILGWPGVAAAVAAVDAEVKRRTKSPDAARWAEAGRQAAAARETIAAAVVGALEIIERRADEIVIDRLNRTRNFVAECWTRYGAVRGQKLVDSLWKGGEFVPTYELTDAAARRGLHDALVPIMAIRGEITKLWLIALAPPDPNEDLDAAVEATQEAFAAIKEAERRLDAAIVDAARGPHPLAAALAHAMSSLWFDEEGVGRVTGEFLDVVRTQMEEWVAKPPKPAVPALRGKEGWGEVITWGPEVTVLARLADPATQLEPLASAPVLQAVGHALRQDGELMSMVVLTHLRRALAATEEARRRRATLKTIATGAAAVIAVALNLAALAFRPLRPVAGALDDALIGYGAIEGVRAALEIDAVRGSAVEREVAEAEQRDLHRLGRAVSEHLEPSGVVPALIQAGISVASLELSVARAGSRLLWLDAADLMLTFAGP